MKSLKCWLNIIFSHQPLGAFINICICQWHVILALVMPSFTFRLGIAVTSVEDITEPHLKILLCSILFPTFESVLLLQLLMETIQSVATIKCALGRFVYNVLKHSYKILITTLYHWEPTGQRGTSHCVTCKRQFIMINSLLSKLCSVLW
jgi:hypothetical protein